MAYSKPMTTILERQELLVARLRQQLADAEDVLLVYRYSYPDFSLPVTQDAQAPANR